ncbi:hypothetical protein E1B28_002910 [Marasmius oreades]|uniref:Subtilisin-like protease n=1 Tax=Marasmius oreades TaxID=181124 RepID=A0A9P7RK24_9AGAR|nr:uncharacterized protein E1B28_002910 [Marasmius oreades]KAG7085344.1 hypothetical protein E1B28_002910 [Marasmius oreades]
MGVAYLFFALLCLSADVEPASVKANGVGDPFALVANRYILELDPSSANDAKRGYAAVHQQLYQGLESRDVTHNVNKEFNHTHFVGVSVTLKSSDDVSKLSTIPGVKAIRQARRFSGPRPVSARGLSSEKNWNSIPVSQSSHVLTGVDKLHAQGVTGEGIKIAIIDTGVDYTHPALGGGFGPGFKIVGGYDFVGDNYRPGKSDPVPDPDPLDQCLGHGTHVAGIIGANPGTNPFNISGVAYSASLSAYRVFGCHGGQTEDEVIIDAMLRAVEDGHDIITLSIGTAGEWPGSTSSVVAGRIAESGMVVTAAAGNDGASGPWYASAPGNGNGVISVASVDTTFFPVLTATVKGATHDPIPYYAVSPLSPVSTPFPVYATSNDTTAVDDACNPLPDSTPDLSSFVVLVRKGTCPVMQQMTNIAAKGGNLTLVYNNVPGLEELNVSRNFKAALIIAEDGEFLVRQLAAGVPVAISFDGDLVQFQDPAGGLVSSFSSFGPTEDMYFKPSVGAPGGNILSSVPESWGLYLLASGTSMATPFAAGSAALLLQATGKSYEVARNIRTLFQTTAVAVPSNHTEGAVLQTVTQQGAGLINVFNAAHTTTFVSPGELLLNDTVNFQAVQNFTVFNKASSPQTYQISHKPAGTAATVTPGTIFTAVGPVPLSNDFASLVLSVTTFMLQAGESKTITANFTPLRVDPDAFPVYSGFIQISSDAEDQAPLHVPYLGLAASLRDKQVVDDTDVVLGIKVPAILNATGDVQKVTTNYTFEEEDFPSVLLRLVFGTAKLRFDLVNDNIEINTTLNKQVSFEEAESTFEFLGERPGGTFGDVPIVGSLDEFNYLARNSLEEDGDPFYQFNITTPTFANGMAIPNGTYKILLRALRVTGDPANESDYESWLSPIVGVTVP